MFRPNQDHYFFKIVVGDQLGELDNQVLPYLHPVRSVFRMCRPVRYQVGDHLIERCWFARPSWRGHLLASTLMVESLAWLPRVVPNSKL